MVPKQATIYDISAKAGVSIATVSRVINGSDKVSEKTRSKILAIMEECGYTPNIFARGLGLNTMKTVGILCADSSDIYYAKAVYYIEKELRENQYDTILCCTGYNLEDRIKSLDLLVSKKVDALILIGSTFIENDSSDNRYIKEAATKVPVMVLNALLEEENVYSVFCNDVKVVENVSNLLISRNKKNLLYFYNSLSYSGQKKLEGFNNAVDSNPLSGSCTSLFCPIHSDEISKITDFVKKYLEDNKNYSAIIASDDVLASCVIKALHSLNLKIPEDVAVIGYNNSILAKCCYPELSSIDNKLFDLCSQLVKSLMEVLSGQEIDKIYEYQGQLIERQTT